MRLRPILILVQATTAAAAELTVLSAGALENGILQLARAFEMDAGHVVRVEIGNAPQLTAEADVASRRRRGLTRCARISKPSTR